MPTPLHIAACGVGIVFALFLLFRERPRRLTYDHRPADVPYPTYVPPAPRPSQRRRKVATVTADKPKQTGVIDAKKCEICKKYLYESEHIKLLCNHIYHIACFTTKWSNECRICKHV